MEKEKMLVTKALKELGILDDRIKREIRNGQFVAAAKTAEKKVTPYVTKENFAASAKSDYQCIEDLIARRSRIKAAVVASNAITTVEINAQTMTVADAIEMKTAIDYKVTLLNALKTQFNEAKRLANSQNIELEMRIDKYIESMLGKEAKGKKDDYSEMIDPIREANEYSIVDPINVDEKIKALENYIDGFRSEVDSALQISNCVTWIEF